MAYDLNDVEPEILGQLFERTPGQVLHEHASCWTDAPAVCADIVTLLHQSNTAPWAGVLRQTEDGSIERSAPDERPEEEIAADIGASEEVETVYLLLEHLAASGRAKATDDSSPAKRQFLR